MSEAPLRHHPECGSTNDLARVWAADPASPAPHGARVTADFQTRGRGRRGRTWEAAPGQNVLLSVILRPLFPRAEAWRLGFLAALAIADVLDSMRLAPRVKWPNDVLLGDGKVAGVLVETVPAASAGGWAAVVGVGLNVNQDRFPDVERLLHPATSLRLVSGQEWDVLAVTHTMADALMRRVDECDGGNWETVWGVYRERLAVGATVQRGNEQATLVGVEVDGSARVRRLDGTFARWASVEGEEGPEIRPNGV